MKEVVVKIFYNERNYITQQKIIVDGREVWNARDLTESPEDALLCRSMTNADDMINFARIFNGEEFEEQTQECDTEEEFNNY